MPSNVIPMDPMMPAQNSGQSKLSKSQRLQAEQEQQLSSLVLQQVQLQRTLWHVLQACGGTVTIDLEQTNPLWELKYEATDKEKPNQILITAFTMPEPTAEQLEDMAKQLVGTSENPLLVQNKVGLANYPTSYLVARLNPTCIWDGKLWVRRAEWDAAQALAKQPSTAPENG